MTLLYTYPDGFPHSDLVEIRHSIAELPIGLEKLFSRWERDSAELNYPFWENNAKLKIVFLVNRFGDNEMLGGDLYSILKDFKEDVILNVESYHKYTYLKKIDIFPFLNFVDEQLSKIKVIKLQMVPLSFTDDLDLPLENNSPIEFSQAETKDSFIEIFTVPDWQKYINALTICEPKLLVVEGNKYKFVGNKKNQRGIVAQYFKFLKLKGIINSSIDRDKLAKVLTNEILDFTIVGSSIDNTSETYKKTFQNQLEKYYNKIN